MISDKEAIEKAAEYLNSLSSGLSGDLLDHPVRLKLESIQQIGEEWVIVLSYLAKSNKNQPDWVNALEGVRRFKEFTVNGSGKVMAMKDPTLA
ncbi:MAG TPA: hypothetical protein VFD13_08745 [Candidatus Kapabacteria bacterium]|nr:hypothetical protein [Candidatus Kapabacteria bacterium]